jgi:hypothetical protein
MLFKNESVDFLMEEGIDKRQEQKDSTGGKYIMDKADGCQEIYHRDREKNGKNKH